jgi:hypothetical protein
MLIREFPLCLGILKYYLGILKYEYVTFHCVWIYKNINTLQSVVFGYIKVLIRECPLCLDILKY